MDVYTPYTQPRVDSGLRSQTLNISIFGLPFLAFRRWA